jgi:hypothetical protein
MGISYPTTVSLFESMRWKRREWTRTIKKVKATHWKEFLDKAQEGHLWKTATYMRPRDPYTNIPILTVGMEEVSNNKEKAKAFLEAFFPKMADAKEEEPKTPY